jgi:glycosyltransferase involved in cell wall biosynthesis
VIEVPTVDLARWLRLQFSVTYGASGLIARIVERARPDLLHANNLQFDTSRVAARLADRSRLPLVTTAHIGGFEALAQPWRMLGAIHDRTIGRYVLSRSDRVVAVSSAVATHLRALGVAEARIRIVPNGVDHHRFVRRSGSHEGLTAVFIGRLVANKGADRAIRAVAAVRADGHPARLLVVGDGPQRSQLEALVRELGVGDAVTFEGWHADVAPFLSGADVFLRPTQTEGMSLTVLEAMASGVCVVASDVPGNAELIRNGVNGLLAPVGDQLVLESQLRRALDDHAERRRLGARAAEDADAYSWERCAEQTLAVFEETLVSRSRRSRAA